MNFLNTKEAMPLLEPVEDLDKDFANENDQETLEAENVVVRKLRFDLGFRNFLSGIVKAIPYEEEESYNNPGKKIKVAKFSDVTDFYFKKLRNAGLTEAALRYRLNKINNLGTYQDGLFFDDSNIGVGIMQPRWYIDIGNEKLLKELFQRNFTNSKQEQLEDVDDENWLDTDYKPTDKEVINFVKSIEGPYVINEDNYTDLYGDNSPIFDF